jgi:hypothetical protein
MSAPPDQPDVATGVAPTHLVVMCHGIWGFPWQFERFISRIAAHPAAGPTLVHTPAVNAALATADGAFHGGCGGGGGGVLRRPCMHAL